MRLLPCSRPRFRTAACAVTAVAAVLTGCARHAPKAIDTTAVVGRVLPAVVRIIAIQLHPDDGRLVKREVGGSGVILSPAGYVLTNYHVAEDAKYFRCFLTDGRRIDARLVGEDTPTDLALLKLEGGAAGPYPFARFGVSAGLKAGDAVFALGSPGFLDQTVTRGVVADPSAGMPAETIGRLVLHGEDIGLAVRWILHDARIYPGNSGGPLVNDHGEVVGINEIGVFDLGGAIPGDLAHLVALELIRTGTVVRGWSGMTVQPRLEADGDDRGVCVVDVAPNSPAERAGMKAGDVILSGNGHPIETQRDVAVAEYYRLEMGTPPGTDFTVERLRQGIRSTATFAMGRRMPAESEPIEEQPWGIVARSVTRQLALDDQLPDTDGVQVLSVLPGGPAGQAEPRLAAGDVIVRIDETPVRGAADLEAATQAELKRGRGGVRSVVASFRRAGALMAAAVRLRAHAEPPEIVPEVRKGWLGLETQPLTVRLAAHWHIRGEGGARITRIYPDTSAARSDLRVGDIVLAVDGDPVTARREEDVDVFARQIREYDPGAGATLTVWRSGQRLQLPVTVDREPQPAEELPTWEDTQLEFTVREAAFSDLVDLQLDPKTRGLFVAEALPSGWAALGGLRTGDLIVTAGGRPVRTLDELRAARNAAFDRKDRWWTLLVRRRATTELVEIDLKPLIQ